MSVLDVAGLSKTYRGRGRGGPVQAIKALDLEISQREFVSVVGPSGCGKSTLLKLIAGLLTPSSGSVRITGRLVEGPVADLGIVFQYPVLLPWRSAVGNVLLPLELMGRDTGPETERARSLLSHVGLEGFEDHRPTQLSGGMQQRVALCRALINRPSLLLMDEPFSALDEFTREGLNDLLLDVWERYRKTVLYVTHSVSEAVYLSDRVAVLSARPGRLTDLVTVSLPRPRTAEHRYGPEFIATVRHVREQLRS